MQVLGSGLKRDAQQHRASQLLAALSAEWCLSLRYKAFSQGLDLDGASVSWLSSCFSVRWGLILLQVLGHANVFASVHSVECFSTIEGKPWNGARIVETIVQDFQVTCNEPDYRGYLVPRMG